MSIIRNINPSAPNNNLPAMPSIGGIVVPDMPFTRDTADDTSTYLATYLRVGVGKPTVTSATLILEDIDGAPIIVQEVLSGEFIYLTKCRRVLSSAMTAKGNFTTTCTHMQWFGGAY